MRVIEPYQLNRPLQKRSRSGRIWAVGLLAVLLVFVGLSTWSYLLPLPTIQADVIPVQYTAKTVNIDWPSGVQAAIGTIDDGVLATSDNVKSAPMASIAKLMTALSVLDRYPLTKGQSGPTITLTAADVDTYNHYLSMNGSVVRVTAGEKISEFQALQAMLLPSANNMADTLARWAFGSLSNYVSYANQKAAKIGLTDTRLAGASGFLPDTVSSARDLVVLGQHVMRHPVLSQIVGTKYAKVPVAGTVHNTNYLLGQDGVVGIKTGNTDEAGICYLFAAKHEFVGGHAATIIGVVMGADSASQVVAQAKDLLGQTYDNFGNRQLVAKGQKVAYYQLPWGDQNTVVAAGDIDSFGWLGQTVHARTSVDVLKLPAPANMSAGKVSYGTDEAAAITSQSTPPPSKSWRLTHWLSSAWPF